MNKSKKNLILTIKFINFTYLLFTKMKHDFKKMEEEMDKLAANMSTITEFSEKITGTLQGKRQQITKLSGVHTLLKKVHVLNFSLGFQT